jgi:hypothetical protein
MTITKITTHHDDALVRLLYQFKDKVKVQAMVSMQADQIQDIEDATFEFLSKIPLQNAVGAMLDRWGVLLNEARLGDNDADYKSRLLFSITRNLSNGTPEELISFTSILLGTNQIQIYEIFPGVVNFLASDVQNTADPLLVKSQLQQLCAAGVRVGWISLLNDPHPFAFENHPNPDARGFDTYPVTNVGGLFISAI